MHRFKAGLTLIELLVVVVILVIFFTLYLPGFVCDREVARRNQCSTQCKNLVLSAIQYENAKQSFPGFVNDYGTFNPPVMTDPSNPEAVPETLRPHRKIGPWTIALLPWLEAQPTYEQWTEDRYPVVSGGSDKHPLSTGRSGQGYCEFACPDLAIMQCPSNPLMEYDSGRNSYIANSEVFTNQYQGNSADHPQQPALRMDDLVDGLSTTVLFSENVQCGPWHRAGFVNQSDLVFDPQTQSEVSHPPYSRYTTGMVRYLEAKPVHQINGGDIFVEVMNASNAVDLARPSSAHVGGVNVGFADGSTRFITDSIDWKVWSALLTPAEGDAIELEQRN